MDLTNICYKQIKDNFYYGLFGDFQLVIDKNTGCFNATKLCNNGGKRYRKWTQTEKSKQLIEYYTQSWRPYWCASFYEVKLPNNVDVNKQITGQYVQKELLLDIASWISIEFYDKCSKIILDYFVAEYKKLDGNSLNDKIKEVEDRMNNIILEKDEEIEDQKNKIDELLDSNKRLESYMRSLGISFEEVKDQNNELIEKVDEQNIKINTIQNKLEIAVEDRAPLPETSSKCDRFVLIKRNDPEYYPYYTIRAQYDYTKRKLKTEKSNFPNMEILLDFTCNPNSKSLFVRIKENLKEANVVFNGNSIDLEDSDITEEDLINEMKTINDSRKDLLKSD